MDGWRAGWTPPELITVSEWADRYRMLPQKASSEPGPWRTSRTPYAREPMDCLSDHHPAREVVMMCAVQMVKALAVDTPIPTPSGWVTMGALREGDAVFGLDGEPTIITAKSGTMTGQRCYRISFDDGSSIVSGADHQWVGYKGAGSHQKSPVTWTTEEIAKRTKPNIAALRIPVCGALKYSPAKLPIDPYVFGLWLGDGNSQSAIITVDLRDGVLDQLEMVTGKLERVQEKQHIVQVHLGKRTNQFEKRCRRGHAKTLYNGDWQCATCSNLHQRGKRGSLPQIEPSPDNNDGMGGVLRRCGVIGNKHIPDQYLQASISQRWALLQGLFDSDGTIDARQTLVSFTSIRERLATDVQKLMWTLGIKAKIRKGKAKLNGRIISDYYRVEATCYSDKQIFRLARKQSRLRDKNDPKNKPTHTGRRSIVEVIPCETVPVECISVDAQDHLYLAGYQCVPTHNSEVGLNWVGYTMDHAPSSMLAVLPTVEVGERWSKQRLAPTIADSPRLREKVNPARSRDSGNTVSSKEFDGGILIITGANSAAGLSSMPIKKLLLDEIDRFPIEIDEEGDPLDIAEARVSNFPQHKIYKCSSPTIESLSRINRDWKRSDQRRYFVPCPHCGEKQHLQWDHLKYSQTDPSDAKYGCEHCGSLVDEHYKTQMLESGEWRATFPERSVVGFHLNALYSPIGLGRNWVWLAKRYEEVKRDPPRLKVFVNTRLGECWVDPDEKMDWEEIKARAESYQLRDIPQGCLVLSAGVDVQKDRIEVQVLGWGRGEQCWVIDYQIIPGDPTRPEVWALLDEYIARPFVNLFGVTLRIRLTGVDTGYLPDDCLNYTRTRSRHGVFAVKGSSTSGRQIIGRATKVDVTWKGATIKGGAEHWMIGPDTAKARFFARLAGDRKHAHAHERMVRFPENLPEDYYMQLTSEVFDPHKRKWVKRASQRNEALDTFVYAMAAGMHPLIRVHAARESDWAKLEASIEPQDRRQKEPGEVNQETAPPVAAAQKRPMQMPRRGGFVTAWRD